MAYNPTTWATGDTITAAKLNNMEQGIENAGGGPLLVTVGVAQDASNNVLDKTWEEIYEAILSRGVTMIRDMGTVENVDIAIIEITGVTNDPDVGFVVIAGDIDYISQTADGYPQTQYNIG